jgi:hypothetical protein
LRRGTIVSVAVAISVDLLAAAVALADADANRLALHSLTVMPTRVGCLHVGQTIITFETSSGTASR